MSLIVGVDFDQTTARTSPLFRDAVAMMYGVDFPIGSGPDEVLAFGFSEEQVFRAYHEAMTHPYYSNNIEFEPHAQEVLRKLLFDDIVVVCPTARPEIQAMYASDFFRRHKLRIPVLSSGGTYNKNKILLETGADVHFDDSPHVLAHSKENPHLRTTMVHYSPNNASSWQHSDDSWLSFDERVRKLAEQYNKQGR